jgi:hypothetical protein
MIKIWLGSIVVLAVSVLIGPQHTAAPRELSDSEQLTVIGGGCQACSSKAAGCGSANTTTCVISTLTKATKKVYTGQQEAFCQAVTNFGHASCAPDANTTALCYESFSCTGYTSNPGGGVTCTGCAPTSISTNVISACTVSGTCSNGGG